MKKLREQMVSSGTGLDSIDIYLPPNITITRLWVSDTTNPTRIIPSLRHPSYTPVGIGFVGPNAEYSMDTDGSLLIWEGRRKIWRSGWFVRAQFRYGDKAAGDTLWLVVTYEEDN